MTGGAATADQIAASGAATTTAILVALGTIGGPVGAVVGGLIALGSEIASMFGGCGQTCVQASNIANQVEPVLRQNLQQYLAAPVHYQSLQTAALNNYNTAMAALNQACANPALGQAGQLCISARQAGACQWKTSPGGWQQSNGTWTYIYPGLAGSGSTCWNWSVGYHDPIANDPTVVPDPGASGAVSGIVSSLGIPATIFGLPSSDVLIAAGLLVGAILISGD